MTKSKSISLIIAAVTANGQIQGNDRGMRHFPRMGISYRDAGVDIDRADALIERIKPVCKSTHHGGVLGAIGGFAGMCNLPEGITDPVLVSGTDGVGTKLLLAIEMGIHSTVGIDLVAMCVNDVIVTGATPWFFLDYFACGVLDTDDAYSVISGIAEGCKQAGCALVGGETAELPGMYSPGEYDLAGFCVGVASRSSIRDGKSLRQDDVLIALPSSGIHSNGFSLVRKAVDTLGLHYGQRLDELEGRTLGEALLTPTVIYADALGTLSPLEFKMAAHITGGGLIENPPRMLTSRQDLAVEMDLSALPQLPLFELLHRAPIDDREMLRTFNMGIGMLIACDKDHVESAMGKLKHWNPFVAGRLIPRTSDAIEFTGEH